MAKKFGKFLVGAALAGAVAAGVYYLLKSDEALEDFDDFDDEINDDLEDFLREEAENSEREYVPLDLSNSENKVDTKEEKIIGDVPSDKDNVVKESDEKKEEAKEFKFTDLSKEEGKEEG